MSSQDNDGQQGVALTVLFGVVAVVVAAVLIAVVALQRGKTSTPKTAVAATATAQPVGAAAAANTLQSTQRAQNTLAAAGVKVKIGQVKF